MSITKDQAKHLRTLVTKRVNAAIAYSWKGVSPPEEIIELEQELSQVEDKLNTFIQELVQ